MGEILLEVEIRPRWDWKKTVTFSSTKFFHCWNQTKMGLKALWALSLMHAESCWNQTKMGLKDLHHLLPFHAITAVEIRPRWDWKLVPVWLRQSVRASWNQTKMGLKGRTGKGRVRTGSELKSDQDGIESFKFKKFVNSQDLLKSDQDGIERMQNDRESVGIMLGWNQTKMGLKV